MTTSSRRRTSSALSSGFGAGLEVIVPEVVVPEVIVPEVIVLEVILLEVAVLEVVLVLGLIRTDDLADIRPELAMGAALFVVSTRFHRRFDENRRPDPPEDPDDLEPWGGWVPGGVRQGRTAQNVRAGAVGLVGRLRWGGGTSGGVRPGRRSSRANFGCLVPSSPIIAAAKGRHRSFVSRRETTP